MKKMVRILVFICLSVCMVFSAFASGKTDTGSDTTTTGKPKSITFMVDGTWILPENGEEIPEKGYEALTGIDLILNHPPHNEYHQKLDLAFATGDIPDVFVGGGLQYVRFAAAGALYDVTEMYEKSKMKSKISTQAIVDACRLDGRLYGIPHHRGNGTLLYVRGDWLEKLGLQPPKKLRGIP